MKYLSIAILAAIATTAGCSTVANNGNNANIRGTNTNTGYMTNSETNAKPPMPVNATNVTPGNVSMPTMNTNSNANTRMMNSNSMMPRNSNSKMNGKP